MSPRQALYHSQATRDRILDYLRENRIASVQALSRAWGLTRADIRYHLNVLVREGLIEQLPSTSEQPGKRGRPEQFYRLATGRSPDNLAALCDALLTCALQGLSESEIETCLAHLSSQMVTAIQPAAKATQRLNQAIDFLTEHGYRAHWEAHASGPRVLLRNCPYAAILERHPELCRIDLHLIEHLCELPLRQTTSMDLESGKPPACIFTT